MPNKFIKLLIFLNVFYDCVLNSSSFQLYFPLTNQPEYIQNAARRGLSTHIGKDFPLPKNVNLIPYVDCVAKSSGIQQARSDQVIRQLESFTRKRFIIEMLKCSGNSRPEVTAVGILRRNDYRQLTFFSATRYVIYQWLKQLDRQERRKRMGKSDRLSDSQQTTSSPLAAEVNINSEIDKIEPIIDSASVQAINEMNNDQLCLGCIFDDGLEELDGIGGVVIGALEEVGHSFIRLSGGLRRFQSDLKRFVNTGTNLLIG